MIPKIIHYCWFGGNPLPQMAVDCINSWKKYLPGYEIKEWNEKNFDVYSTPYVEEAYRLKKYAFVSDYARFWILYHYGGLYFDIDVEVLQSIDDIIARGAFMGMEKLEGSCMEGRVMVNPGLGLGAEAHHPFFREIIDMYNRQHYVGWNGKMTGTVVMLVSDMINEDHMIDPSTVNEYKGIFIYPDEYFDPMNYYTGTVTITGNTRSIHHYAATWVKRSHFFLFKWKVKAEFISTRIYVMIMRYLKKR